MYCIANPVLGHPNLKFAWQKRMVLFWGVPYLSLCSLMFPKRGAFSSLCDADPGPIEVTASITLLAKLCEKATSIFKPNQQQNRIVEVQGNIWLTFANSKNQINPTHHQKFKSGEL